MATMKQKTKARAFLIIEIFRPKYFISTGNVTTPTAISVEIKTDNDTGILLD
jgi:hypothetical protein